MIHTGHRLSRFRSTSVPVPGPARGEWVPCANGEARGVRKRGAVCSASGVARGVCKKGAETHTHADARIAFGLLSMVRLMRACVSASAWPPAARAGVLITALVVCSLLRSVPAGTRACRAPPGLLR
jgi:hypothetical protein